MGKLASYSKASLKGKKSIPLTPKCRPHVYHPWMQTGKSKVLFPIVIKAKKILNYIALRRQI